MRFQSESQFTKKVRKDLESIGAFHEKVSDRYAIGRPDINVVINGVSIRLESKKSTNGDFKSTQIENLIAHNRKGKGIGLFIHPGNWDEVFELLKDLKGVEKCGSYERLRIIQKVQLTALIEKKVLFKKKP